MHTNTQAAKAEFNPTDYCYRRNQDIYLYVQSPIQINTNSTVTLTHFYHTHTGKHTPTHKHTWGQCTSVGSPMAKGCKALRVFLLKEKKKKRIKQQQKKDRTVHIERGDFLNFFLHKKSGWRRRDWAWLEDCFKNVFCFLTLCSLLAESSR